MAKNQSRGADAGERRPAQGTPRQSGGGFLLGMFIGLLAGLLVAMSIAFYVTKTPTPITTKSSAKDAIASTPNTAPIPGMVRGAPDSKADAKGSGKDGEKSRFDFYNILPGGEQAVSDKELREREQQEKATKAGPPPVDGPRDLYFIQAGAFQSPSDADNQKARLALIGLESSVEPTVVPDKGTLYRVRIGPYSRIDEINRLRQTLAQNGIEASLVKMRDNSPPKPN